MVCSLLFYSSFIAYSKICVKLKILMTINLSCRYFAVSNKTNLQKEKRNVVNEVYALMCFLFN